MAWRPHGRAKVDARSPRAWGVCDRCGRWFNLCDLQWQFDWRGTQLQNLRILVCEEDYDTPQEQLRTIVLPPDPPPVFNVRPESFFIDDTQEFESQGLVQIVAQDGTPIISQGGDNITGAQNSSVRQLIEQIPPIPPV